MKSLVALAVAILMIGAAGACSSSSGGDASPGGSEAGAPASGDGAGASDASGPAEAPPDATVPSSDAAPSDAAGADAPASDARDAPFVPAFAPAPPQLLTSGGHLLTAPKLQVITFPNDAFAADLELFAQRLGASAYWSSTTKEYGIGAATALPPVHLTETAATALTDTEIDAWLVNKVNTAAPGFAPADDEVLYIVYYPATTTITFSGSGAQSCTYFGGYHTETQAANGQRFSYAIMPRCATFGALKGIDAVTFPTSHEVFEAATDPLPGTSPGYDHVDDDHFAWSVFFLNEGGDLCVEEQVLDVKPADIGYSVQRVWSNAAAKAQHSPCVPGNLVSPYFNAAPVLPDTASVASAGGQVTTKVVKIPVGQTKTIDLQLFSDAPIAGWNIDVLDYASDFQQQTKELSFALDATHGANGDVLHLSITSLVAGASGFSAFAVRSKAGSLMNFWPGIVVN